MTWVVGACIVLYGAGVYLSAPVLTRSVVDAHKRDWPDLWGGKHTARWSRKCANEGFLLALMWPTALPILIASNLNYRRTK